MTEVTTQTEFLRALSVKETDIVVMNNISLTAPATIRYAVTIRGNPGVSLIWANPTAGRRRMFVVAAAGDLTIESLTLDAENRDGTLVHIIGGRFTMNGDSTLKNVKGRTAQSAVQIADLDSQAGGTFIMNGGVITGIDSSDSVFCSGGDVIMNGDAAIRDNNSAGVTMTIPMDSSRRPSLVMTGRSRISGNASKQSGGAGILMAADITMGLNPGDAPAVTGNSSPYTSGGWYITEGSVLTMRYDSEISDNYAPQYAAGLAVSVSTVYMHGNASVKNNRTDGDASGIMLSTRSTATLDDNASISGNTAGGRGGGIYAQRGAVLNVKGSASIYGNSAADGGGIYLNVSTANIGVDDSTPAVTGNTATGSGSGGGIYVSPGSRLNLSGTASLSGNSAAMGNGIFKEGLVAVSQSPTVSDGLFFNDLQPAEAQSVLQPAALHAKLVENSLTPLPIPVIAPQGSATAVRIVAPEPPVPTPPIHSDNVSIIDSTLAEAASILLEPSDYVNPSNVPLVIADKSAACAPLGETDRSAWILPPEFGEAYSVILSDALDQVIVAYTVYTITYHELFGAENPNPSSYNGGMLPLGLNAPIRPGYRFMGWIDDDGRHVAEIPAGTTGNLSFTAIWQALTLSFDGNGLCVCGVPEPIYIVQGERIRLPSTAPCRPCHRFLCWNAPSSGSGRIFFPGDVFIPGDKSVTLYAQWRPVACHAWTD